MGLDNLEPDDRDLVLDDYKKRIIDWLSSNRQLPLPDIYDEPVRYYKANLKWTPHISGLLLWLADVAAWPESSDENYTAIQQILKYLVGVEPPTMSCADVEDCLETSTIIDSIENDVDTQSGGGYTPSKLPKELQEFPAYAEFVTPDVVTPANGCDDADKAKLWAFIKGIIFNIDNRNRHVINAVHAGTTDLGEALTLLATYIPTVQGLTQAQGQLAAQFFASTLKAAYDASVDNAFLYTAACAIFCDKVSGDCTGSLEDIMAYFQSQLAGSPGLATASLLDVWATLLGQSGGAELFYALSWLQLAHVVCDEKFQENRTISNLYNWSLMKAATGESSWKIYCTDCADPISSWVIVFDFANDYVEQAGEIVIRDAARLLVDSLTNNGTGTQIQQYQEGLITRGASARRRIEFGGTFSIGSVRPRYRRGTGQTGASTIDFFPGNGYNFAEYSTSSEVFATYTYKGLGSLSPPDDLIGFEFSTVVSNIAQIWLTGQGQPPQF